MRYSLIFLLMITMIAGVASAEDYTWTDQPFTVTLPDGWEARESGDSLLLGQAEDLDRITTGQASNGIVISVEVIDNLVWGSDVLRIVGRPTVETVSFANGDWSTTATEFNGRLVTIVHLEGYLLTASAPLNAWNDAQFNAVVGSISFDAPNVPEMLSQTVVVGDVALNVLPDWLMIPLVVEAGYMISTHEARQEIGAMFAPVSPVLIIRDVSNFASVLPPEMLFQLSTFYYQPDELSLTPNPARELNGFTAYTADFASEGTQGAVAILSGEDHAYLMVMMAGESHWDQTLFTSILESIEKVAR